MKHQGPPGSCAAPTGGACAPGPEPGPGNGAPTAAVPAWLNQTCFCLTLDAERLQQALAQRLPEDLAAALIGQTQLFSSSPLFVARRDLDAMAAAVAALEAAIALPGYREAVLARADPIAAFGPLDPRSGPLGVFMGYDFHLGADGPQLIEINTNAGGAFLNACLAQAQWACCDFMQLDPGLPAGFEARVLAMFEAEWRRQRGSGRPSRIAIVDTDPERQFLHPEFRLAQALLRDHGIDTVIADPAALQRGPEGLYVAGARIDLVYNRLTDFLLQAPEHAVLRAAWLAGEVVLTPHPQAWALHADKRNLALLSDTARLRDWGLPAALADRLAAVVPATVEVRPEHREQLWQDRHRLFFKPVSGHGSKGVYRGAKLTRGVFERILSDGYVAQAYAPPGERRIRVDGIEQPLKADLRLYTYGGEVLLQAARLYQGQATNLRTPGGGFAPVFVVD